MMISIFIVQASDFESVIPAKAGIQFYQAFLDPGLRRGDGSVNSILV